MRLALALASATIATCAYAASAPKGKPFGTNDEYGGNINATSGRGFAYLTSKKAWTHEGINGYTVVVRWYFSKSKELGEPEHYNVVCDGATESVITLGTGAPAWGIDTSIRRIEHWDDNKYPYDIWWTVCRNQPKRF